MTENDDAAGGPVIGTEGLGATAGSMLRAAREKRGMHIAALAAAIKVPQRKLEALEADRHDELPDLTFARALAQTVCRALKIDAQPVLDRLPQSVDTPRLARMGSGINAPFRESSGRDEGADWSWVRRPVVWGTLIVLAAAVALVFLPESWRSILSGRVRAAAMPAGASTAAPAARVTVTEVPLSVAAAPASSASATESAASQPVVAPDAAASVTSPGNASSVLHLRTTAQSWIEVQDAHGQTLISRHVEPGETVDLDGALPLRVTIGNAAATQVSFRGQPVDLSANTLGNVARIQLN
jgi:cytoskeleton protein RodZ